MAARGIVNGWTAACVTGWSAKRGRAGCAITAAVQYQFHCVRNHTGLLLGSEHKRHTVYGQQIVPAELGVAACDDDPGSGGDPVHLPDHIAALLLGPLRDRASVDQVDISLLLPRDDLKAVRRETSLVSRCLGVVELAAECQKRYPHPKISILAHRTSQ